MKKVLLSCVALFAAMSMSAKEWDFSANPINTKALLEAVSENDGFTINENMTSDEEPESYISLDYKGITPNVATLTFNENAPIQMKFTFSHKSDDKTDVAKIYDTYFQFNRQFAALEIECKVGDVITFYPKSYSKATYFKITGAEQTKLIVPANSTDPVSVTATATSVKFDSSEKPNGEAQACQITKITVIGENGSAIHNAIAEKISFNGNVISNIEGLNLSVYNVLGKLVATSNSDIDMSAYQTGVYVVRAEGVKGAMKIRK